MRIAFGYDGFSLQIGYLEIESCGTGWTSEGKVYYPFGWFDVYWGDKIICQLGQKHE